jgi:hypothetical protein
MTELVLASGASIAEPLGRMRTFMAEEYDYYDGIPSEEPNHIGPVDVLATVAMNSYVNDAAKVRAVQRGMAARCDPLLREIPENADLADVDLEVVRELVHEAVQVRNVLVPVATKVLYRKRRSLIPMLDSVVLRYYQPGGRFAAFEDKRRAASAALPVLEAFREDLSNSREPLEGLSQSLHEDGYGGVTALRVLEVLVWTEVEPRGYYAARAGSPPA